jgi:hypothetical protein
MAAATGLRHHQRLVERMTMEEMFPLHRLGGAKRAVYLGLVLRDGTIAYGDARPRACR